MKAPPNEPSPICLQINVARAMYKLGKSVPEIAATTRLSEWMLSLALNADKIQQRIVAEGIKMQRESFLRTMKRRRMERGTS